MFSSVLNKNPLKCRIIIRLDDIAPNMNWDMMKRTKDLFKKYKILKTSYPVNYHRHFWDFSYFMEKYNIENMMK